MNEYNNLTLEQINNALKTLSTAELSCILSATDVEKRREQLMNAKQQKIIESYPIRIWQASNGTWKAHVPDDTKPRNRKVLQGKTRENLENNILKDYQNRFDNKLVFANYFAEWLTKVKSQHVQAATLQRNLDDYNKFIKGTKLDKMSIADIEPYDIKELLHSVINEHHLTRKALGNVKSM